MINKLKLVKPFQEIAKLFGRNRAATVLEINELVEEINEEFANVGGGTIQEAADADPNTTTSIRFYDENGRQVVIGSNGISTGDISDPFYIYGTGAYTAQYTDRNGRIKPYKSYVARLEQDGTNAAPTVAFLNENNIGNIVWTRQNTGTYIGTLTGAFGLAKTRIFFNLISGSVGNEIASNAVATGANTVRLSIYTAAISPQDGFQGDIEIRVYE